LTLQRHVAASRPLKLGLKGIRLDTRLNEESVGLIIALFKEQGWKLVINPECESWTDTWREHVTEDEFGAKKSVKNETTPQSGSDKDKLVSGFVKELTDVPGVYEAIAAQFPGMPLDVLMKLISLSKKTDK
jgi:hypothetical protein